LDEHAVDERLEVRSGATTQVRRGIRIRRGPKQSRGGRREHWPCRRGPRWSEPAVEARRAVHRLEEVRERADRLGVAEEEHTPGHQGVMEEWNELPLQLGRHVDEHVATGDEVEPREWRIHDHVLWGKHDRL